jgi:hypothetical protein
MNVRRIPLYMLVAIAGILISGSMAAFLQYSSFAPVGDGSHIEHGNSQSEAEAVKYPLEISDLYKLVRTQGDTDYGEAYLQYHEDVINSERSCEFCTLIEYTPGPKGQSEISFMSTRGYDLTGAKKATIFLMGSQGDETVRVKVAGKGQVQKEFAATTEPINLGSQWKKYEIDLTGNTDLKSITDAFKIVVKASDNQGEPIAFYVKHLTFEATSAKNPVPLESGLQGANGG